MSFEEFQVGCHFSNSKYVAPIPPIKFRLNLNLGLGGDVVRNKIMMASVAVILNIGMERFYKF